MPQVIERLRQRNLRNGYVSGDQCFEKLPVPVFRAPVRSRPVRLPLPVDHRQGIPGAEPLLIQKLPRDGGGNSQRRVPAFGKGRGGENGTVRLVQVLQEDQDRASGMQEGRMLVGRQRVGPVLSSLHCGAEGSTKQLPFRGGNLAFAREFQDSILHPASTGAGKVASSILAHAGLGARRLGGEVHEEMTPRHLEDLVEPGVRALEGVTGLEGVSRLTHLDEPGGVSSPFELPGVIH
jgi:hypothetical protein